MRSFRFWSLARSHWTAGRLPAVLSRTLLPPSNLGLRAPNDPSLSRPLLGSFPSLPAIRLNNVQCLNAMSVASNLCMSLVGMTARSMLLPISIHLQNGFQVRWSRATKNPKWWKTKPGLGKPGGKKLKTHKGAKKRFIVTRMGKVGYMPSGKQHLNYSMSSRKRAKLRQRRYLNPTQAKIIRKLLLMDRRPRNIRVLQAEPLKLREAPLSDEEWEAMKVQIAKKSKSKC
uniref:50S ribosomal protein L35 n=1 Tax=Guillardia theta TaxID=55529 RepID=A0A6U5YDV2_GUITH|mmetsp:Transcript_21435/g.71003  ORF Transcript_21435/g.71003 Transcript_21435/m.71003 type:complete len:229 (+) Transcript_21435:1177-1863(+)